VNLGAPVGAAGGAARGQAKSFMAVAKGSGHVQIHLLKDKYRCGSGHASKSASERENVKKKNASERENVNEEREREGKRE